MAIARAAYERLREHDLAAILAVRFGAAVRGAALEQRLWQTVRAADGKASWWGAYRTREEALEAVRSLAG